MKWHYTTIHFGAMTELGLSAIEYIVSDITYHRTSAGTSWWAYSPTEIGELLGISENTVRDVVARCVEKGTIAKDSKQIISCQTYIDVVYPPSGINSRSSGINSRQATGETPAHLNIYSKKNTIVSDETYEIEEVEENPRKKPAKRKDSHILEGFRLFASPYPKFWEVRPAQREAMERLLTERGTEQVKKALQVYRDGEGKSHRPAIHTPYDLEGKWQNLLDFKERHSL